MARNLQFQPLRGPDANLSIAMPLAMGEMYFATDTGRLYFGTPGVGSGYIQLGDTTKVQEQLAQLIVIMESVRRALVSIACEGGAVKESDFDLNTISEELASSTPIGL